MCGGGFPANPFGYSMTLQMGQWQPMGMDQQRMDAAMMGNMNQFGVPRHPEPCGLPNYLVEPLPPKKKPHCVNCGRPVKPDTYAACKGCGSWEIEFK